MIRDESVITSMSAGEQFIAGGQVAILGMVIVFSILLILMLAVKGMEITMVDTPQAQPVEKSQKESTPQEKDTVEEEEGKDQKLLAVISAAVASYLGEDKKFRVTRIRKIEDDISSWGKAARGGNKSSNFFENPGK